MPRNVRAASTESRRDAASRNLLEVNPPAPELSLDAIRNEHLDLTLGDSVNVSNAIIDWGERPARRQHMKVMGIRISPKGGSLGVSLLDIRGGRLNVGCRFTFNFEDAGDLANGMAVILPHNGFTFSRSTRSWNDEPRGGLVRCIEADVPVSQYITSTQSGMISERSGKQLLFQSSFGNGDLPAQVGAGSTSDDSQTIFDNSPNILVGLLQRVILTAGDSHDSDGVQAWPTSRAAVGSSFLTLSMYHHDDAGATLYWRLRRTSDLFYWDEASRTWPSTSVVNNPMPTVLTSVGFQVASRAIPSSATTYTFSTVQPSGGTVSRVNRVHHVQLEEKRFESSPMPLRTSYSEGCQGFRDNDNLQVCNDVSARVILKERGTMLTRFVPKWSTTDVDGMKMHVFAVEYDSNNSIALYYDGVNSTKNRFVLEVRAGGVTTTIAAVYAVTRYTEIRLGMRWASLTYDELGEEYGTPSSGNAWYDLWAGAAILATGTQATMPTETNESRLQIMCRDGENIDGVVEDFTILKTVLTAEEMAEAL